MRQAKQRAREIRSSLKAPEREELTTFKAALEKKYQISLKDDAKNSREIAYVNTQNSREIAQRVIHTDLLALYLLPDYLRESILKDHETTHFKTKSEVRAYTQQSVNVLSVLKNAIPPLTQPSSLINNISQQQLIIA
ncbi:hypothetical protein ACFLQ1_02870, partial [Candidatus Auribacterota bacterium]